MPEFSELISLLILFLLCFLSTWMIPLPVTAYVMWLGQFDFPVTIVLVSTIGTVLGWVTFEPLLKRLLQKRPTLAQKIPRSYEALFLRQTGFFLFFFNAAPFPIDFMRFLAMMNQYPRGKFLLALTSGRLIRNALLVFLGATLARYTVAFWGVLMFFMVLPLLVGRFFEREVTGVDEEAVISELADELRAAAEPPAPQK